MKSISIVLVTISVVCLYSCSKEDRYDVLRINGIWLEEFLDSVSVYKWDTIDGPDMYITVSRNDTILFNSKIHLNVTPFDTPLNFNLIEPIQFGSSIDKVVLNAYDSDGANNETMEIQLELQPGFPFNTNFSRILSCGGCPGKWKIQYERLN